MADRVVAVKLRADAAGFKREMDSAAKATKDAMGDAEKALDDVGDAGKKGGEDAGEGLLDGVKGGVSAMVAIPIAGAVLALGGAIAVGLAKAIQDGLAIEVREDLFSARTGLDEGTARKFGRAAGEAYAGAWGESIESNLDIIRMSLQSGILDEDATEAEAQALVSQFSAVVSLFEFDMPMAVRGVGNLMKTGLAKDAEAAFDLIVAASQKIPAEDLMDTVNEYANQWVTAGLTGEQAMGLIVQAAQNGARDTDKVADTLKEMGLRIREGTKPAKDALNSLKLDAEAIISAFQRGGPDGAAAMDEVFDALRDLRDEGGNTQEVIAALFGGPGEDLGAALFAMDLDTAAEALGGLEGAAGATDRAMTTMADNTAAQMESAKRNVEVAMEGIKGALAAAFSDDIDGAAQWVQQNRGPLMEFMLAVINGTFEMAQGFVDFSVTALRAIADVIDGLARLIDSLPGDQSELRESMEGIADGLRGAADTMETDWSSALGGMQARVNEWAGPEIMAAHVHDAQLKMSADMDAFSQKVDESGGTVTINGDKVDAETALSVLMDNVNASDGTVTIDGDRVPAEDALDTILAHVAEGRANIKVGADMSEAYAAARAFTPPAAYMKIYGTVEYSSPAGTLYRASGGYISGPGTPTSDSIPIRASKGEYVIKADTVAKRPLSYWNDINAGRFATGGMVGGSGSMAGTITAADPRVEVKVTNNYPQAEPTSVTVNRGLQFAAALGVL